MVGGSGARLLAEHPAGQRRYREQIDALFAAVAGPAQSEAPAADAAEDDFLLATASRGLALATTTCDEQGRCRYCWVRRELCFCDKLPLLGAMCPGIRWVWLCHPQEFLRSSSSGKLIAQVLGGELLVYGSPGFERRLGEVLDDSRMYVLFPTPDSSSVGEVASAAGERVEAEGTPDAEMVVLVPDGSMQQARAMLASAQRRRQPALRYMRLDEHAVKAHRSPLIDALKAGAGRDRLSTFEACALLVAEAEVLGAWGVRKGTGEAAQRSLEPMVAVVRSELEREFGPQLQAEGDARKAPPPADAEMELWIAALRDAASRAPCPAGVKRCCVCGAALSSPVRMRDHLVGRRHCAAVAERRLGRACGGGGAAAAVGRGGEVAAIAAKAAEEAFREHSYLPMSRCTPEPPDLALSLLHAASCAGAAPGDSHRRPSA